MYRKERLENDITFVSEQMSGVRSFTAGIWVKVGARSEPRPKNGMSHFLEHMFFKGTRRRTARQIAIEVDSIGGDLNAYTSKENTTFFIKVLDIHMGKGLDLLADIFCHSTLPEEEIEKERGVILEEIKMVEDTPDDLVHDIFSKNIWGGEGLGQPVLGDRDTVGALSRADLIGHIRKYYGIKDTIVSCVGSFEHEELRAVLIEKLGALRRGSEPRMSHAPAFRSSVSINAKDLSEVHLCIGLPGLPQADARRYEFYILNSIFGSGISSRLFQEIREKRGLVYTIYSYVSSYVDTGLWGVYAGTGGNNYMQVIELVLADLKTLADTLTQAELDKAKEQLKGNLLLGLESTQSRMQNIAKQEIYFGKYFSPQEIIRDIDAVGLKGLKDFAASITQGVSPALTVLGPVEGQPFGEALPPL